MVGLAQGVLNFMTRKALLFSSALVALACAGSAFAQTETSSGAAVEADEAGAVELGGVVITAERRQTSVQDIPVAVTAITSTQRDLLGIQSIQDITQFTPGFSYNTGNDRSSIRGISRFTNNQASQGSVAIYSDGVYTSSTFEAGKPTIFTDRVEVLRGPQGTLYGRNAIGGAINIISRRPTEDWYAEVRGNVGNFGFTEFSGAVSGPITDWLRFRVAAHKTNQTDGWYHNVMQSSTTGNPSEGSVRDEYYVEGQLDFNIGEAFEGWVKLGYREWNNDNGGPGQRSGPLLYPYNTTVAGATNIATTALILNPLLGYTGVNPTCPTFTLNNNVIRCSASDFRSFDANTPALIDLDNAPVASAEFIFHASGFDVKYTTGYARYRYGLDFEVDNSSATGTYIAPGSQVPCVGAGNPIPSCTGPGLSPGVAISRVGSGHYQEDKEWYSNEITLVSTGDGPFSWVVGGYQYHDNNSYTPLDVRSPNQPQLDNPVRAYDLCVGAGIGIHSPVLGPAVVAVPGCLANGQVIVTQAGAPNPLRRYFYNHFDGGTDSWAIFGQSDYELTEDLTLTVGLRYSHDRTEVEEVYKATCFGTALCSGSVSPLANFAYDVSDNALLVDRTDTDPSVVVPGHMDADGYFRRTLRQDWSAVTGNARLQWQPNPDLLTYVSYTRGYKAGGFNAGVIAADATADPEYVNAYEVGLKRTWGRVFQMNASLFYYDYQDAQAPLRGPTPVGLRTDYVNIPSVRNLGLELETLWRPVDDLQIMFNYALLDTKITSHNCYVDPVDTLALQPQASPAGCPVIAGAQSQDLFGQRMPSSPLNRLTVNANYTFRFDPGNLVLSATWTYRSNTYYDIFNRDYSNAPAYDQTDLRATFTDTNNRYTVIGYVRNAFDELGYDGSGSAGIAPAGITRVYGLTPPRTYGVELQYRFF
jgi:iron complex outermembrane receptor protein